MEIILLKNIEKVGKKFEIVKVKDGYGRNFLIPQGLAIIANKANRNNLESYKRQEVAKLNKIVDTVKDIAEQLRGKSLRVVAKCGTSGKIFGSVTPIHIITELKEQLGIEVDRRNVEMPEHIKLLGKYVAKLDLHPDVETNVDFEVVGEEGQTAESLGLTASPAEIKE
jgi:large subunit ribosomal protein L9